MVSNNSECWEAKEKWRKGVNRWPSSPRWESSVNTAVICQCHQTQELPLRWNGREKKVKYMHARALVWCHRPERNEISQYCLILRSDYLLSSGYQVERLLLELQAGEIRLDLTWKMIVWLMIYKKHCSWNVHVFHVCPPMNLKPIFVSLCAEQISRLLRDSLHSEGWEGSPLGYTGSM